jgi:hypothetical protein
MAQSVKRAFTIEMALASAARISGNRGLAMHYLERAHIVGQRYLFAHLRTHLCMLRLAMQCGDWGEVRGQVARLLAVLPGYVFGWVPVGNPGSARVSPVMPMPIPDDLKVYFLRYSVRRHMLWRGIVLAGCALLAAGIAP